MSRRESTTQPISCVVAACVMLAAGPAGGQASPAGPVVGACHVSPIVENLDTSARFYHDLLGLDLVPTPPPGPLPVDTDPGHLHLHGLPQARLRFIGARMPGVRCGVELVEFTAVDRTPVRPRLSDPGAVTLILLVRDIDAAFTRLKGAGVHVVTTGGAPLNMSTTNKTRAVIVTDPDGHFVELVQVDPLPDTTLPPASNIIGIRLRVTVGDLDRTVQYYRSVLGIEEQPRPFISNRNVTAMMGVPDAEYRSSTGQVPGSPLLLEFLEFKALDATPLRSRVQDPGSYRLQLNVRDIDSSIALLRGAGSRVISTGGEPVRMTFGGRPWRLAVLPDLNNLFLIVQQGPLAPANVP